jgi:hypothetical protein
VLQLTDAQLGMLAIAATACRRPSAGDGSSGIGAFGHHEDRTPTHGYAATREAAWPRSSSHGGMRAASGELTARKP